GVSVTEDEPCITPEETASNFRSCPLLSEPSSRKALNVPAPYVVLTEGNEASHELKQSTVKYDSPLFMMYPGTLQKSGTKLIAQAGSIHPPPASKMSVLVPTGIATSK